VPPAAQSHGAAGPPRKGPSPALLIVIIVLVVAAAAAAAVFFLILPDGSQDGHSETPTPIASSSHTPPSPAAQQYLAAAVGRRGNTLATIAADGTIKELSTTVGEKVFQLAWSPDGTRLACVAGTWERPLLWLYETSSDGVRQIQIPAPALIAIDSVAWLSADELLIAGFTTSTTTGGENGELVVFKPASDSAEPLRNGEGTPLRGIEVSASADGTRVSYVSFVDRTSDQNGAVTATEQLMLLDRDGGSLTMLGTEKAYLDWNDRAFSKPLLAPDGEALICAQTGGDIGCSYKVIDANGTTLMDTERLHLMYPTGYAWDPSSQKVVFTGHTSETGSAIFYVYDRSAGGNAHALTSYKRTYVENLAWSPDGSAIAWGEWDRDSWRTGTLWLTPAGGGDAKRVADWAILPAWAPGAVATLPP
jgi:Tol biopolymer transport system component